MLSSIIFAGIISDLMSEFASLNDIFSSPFETAYSPYVTLLGSMAYLVVWMFLSGMVYMKTNNLLTVAVTWVIFFVLFRFIFFESYEIIRLFAFILVVAFAGVLFNLFVRNR